MAESSDQDVVERAAAASMRWGGADIRGWPVNASDTVARPTPALIAMSRWVARGVAMGCTVGGGERLSIQSRAGVATNGDLCPTECAWRDRARGFTVMR